MKRQTLCWLLEEEQTSTIEVTLPVGMKKKKIEFGTKWMCDIKNW